MPSVIWFCAWLCSTMDTVAGVFVSDEVLFMIFQNLDLQSVPNVALVCKRWAELMRDGELIFKMGMSRLCAVVESADSKQPAGISLRTRIPGLMGACCCGEP